MQKFLLINRFRMHGGHVEHTFRKGSGLVEDNRSDFGQSLKIVGTFDQDSFG